MQIPAALTAARTLVVAGPMTVHDGEHADKSEDHDRKMNEQAMGSEQG